MTLINSVNATNNGYLTSVESSLTQRIFRPFQRTTVGNSFSPVQNDAWFIYCGRALSSITPQHIMVQQTQGVASTTAIGIFSTPLPPNKSNQTLTCLVSSSVSATSGTFKSLSTGVLATAIAAGTHMWVGMRISSASVPGFGAAGLDYGDGALLYVNSSAGFSVNSTYNGVIVVDQNSQTTSGPNCQITLD